MKVVGLPSHVPPIALNNLVDDSSPQLGGALDGQGNDLTALGVVFLTEQAAAEADVAGQGQVWVQTATPNVLMFTDDAGTDFTLAHNATTSLPALTTVSTSLTGVLRADSGVLSVDTDVTDLVNPGAGFIDAITEIDGSLRAGADATLLTGTAGTDGNLSAWNTDGDLVDGPTPPTGTIVGTTDSQTLTNKTLTTPTVGDFTNAGHSHEDAAGGGTLSAAAIASGTLAHERGGLDADVSAYSGLVKISGGASSAVTAPTGDVVGTTDSQTLTNKVVSLADSASVAPLNITERSAAPSSPNTGDIYLDDGTNTGSGNPRFRRYTGATWEDIGG